MGGDAIVIFLLEPYPVHLRYAVFHFVGSVLCDLRLSGCRSVGLKRNIKGGGEEDDRLDESGYFHMRGSWSQLWGDCLQPQLQPEPPT